MKTNQMGKAKGYLFRVSYSKGVSHYHLCLGRDSEEGGKALQRKKKKRKVAGTPGVEAGDTRELEAG